MVSVTERTVRTKMESRKRDRLGRSTIRERCLETYRVKNEVRLDMAIVEEYLHGPVDRFCHGYQEF